jgi:AraC family transcriptional regulator, regulatory protein of adaptative response / methylated-DNA-[protein]-cysteine methyltransferase
VLAFRCRARPSSVQPLNYFAMVQRRAEHAQLKPFRSSLTPAAPSREDDVRWHAVISRDATYDGAFVYTVATTGVFCRPSCPSRQAKRGNVAFHATIEAARAAGYRACKRCKPDQALPDTDVSAKLSNVCRHIEAAETPPKLADLAALAGLSPYHFHRVFKSLTGVTPRAYDAAHRAARLRYNLAGAATVTRAMMAAGYSSSGHFYGQSAGVLA